MNTLIKSPDDCSQLELNIFEQMTKEGGQVELFGLRSRIEQAEKLIFIWQDDICVAIAAIKNPNAKYKEKIFKAAGAVNLINEYKFEIGYIYANVKGVGNQLMQGIVEASQNAKCFATTRDDNAVMQHLLSKYAFPKLGDSYLNNSKEYHLGLFGNET